MLAVERDYVGYGLGLHLVLDMSADILKGGLLSQRDAGSILSEGGNAYTADHGNLSETIGPHLLLQVTQFRFYAQSK